MLIQIAARSSLWRFLKIRYVFQRIILLQSDMVCVDIVCESVKDNFEICLILWRQCKRLLTERSRNFASLSKLKYASVNVIVNESYLRT